MSVALLIVDEVGFQPLSRQEAGMLFRPVSYRYRRGSMIRTTNRSVKNWPEILASTFEADFTDEHACRAMAVSCVELYGQIDILYNNVGIGGGGAGSIVNISSSAAVCSVGIVATRPRRPA